MNMGAVVRALVWYGISFTILTLLSFSFAFLCPACPFLVLHKKS
jgi:hypothetical protein